MTTRRRPLDASYGGADESNGYSGYSNGNGNAYNGSGYGQSSYGNTGYGGESVNPYSAKPTGAGGGKKRSNNFAMPLLPWILSACLLCAVGLCRHQTTLANDKLSAVQKKLDFQIGACQKQTHKLELDIEELHRHSARDADTHSDYANIMKETDKLRKENGRLMKEVQNLQNEKSPHMPKRSEEKDKSVAKQLTERIEIYHKREKALRDRIKLLTKRIERDAYRQIVEVYGDGVHEVQISVDLPRDSEKDAHLADGEHPHFVVRLYSIHDIPHAVHLFLDQVYHGLWDGCAFVVNAPHILQAGANPVGISDHAYDKKMEEFAETGLDTIAYQEYSKKHPHKKWTLGFAGRPGGPDFYINKMDNSKNHGPGGQPQHAFGDEEADPCFGEVSEGFDVLERIFQYQTDAKKGHAMTTPLTIVAARVVDHEDVKHADHVPHLEEMDGAELDYYHDDFVYEEHEEHH
jgi:cyclophilin family peptidyl-prolyl cis-trans isomerase/cell division protein FtsB